ncbi:protein-tyrosine-phosphatase [Peijinzhouia sedimentorum]
MLLNTPENMNFNLPLFPRLKEYLQNLKTKEIPQDRKEVLQVLIDYIQAKQNKQEDTHLNFICTHNSRRSQFAQIWAQTAANLFRVKAICYSGGVETTAFNERAVAAMERAGFKVDKDGEGNPKYSLYTSENSVAIKAFSKLFDDPSSPNKGFAAVMTCSHADENCPFIPGTEARIPLLYDDPKAFDRTELEAQKYDERCKQIATEMIYVFSKV